jgi:uncharacterized membrane protein
VLWIGLLYFFNWVNGAFQAQLDAETKKKVVPELMPRALFWFRWGAAFTWLSGVALLMKLYYAGPFARADGAKEEFSTWFMVFAALFVGFLVYDILFKTLGAKAHAVAVVLWGLIAIGFGCWLESLGWSQRAINIHIGALFGTSMAANVWMRIWPAQKRIITAVKAGEKPNPADPALAGLRSKHNTYMSVPLLLLMVSVHQDDMLTWPYPWQYVQLVMLVVGFGITWCVYNVGVPRVKGF